MTLIMAHVSLVLFGNSLKLKTNFLYFIHHVWCRLRSTFAPTVDLKSSSIQNAALQLKQDGFAKLAPMEVSELSAKVFDYFTRNPVPKGIGNMGRDAAAELAPLVYKVLNSEVESVLCAHYRSFFQPYWINFMRYEAGYQHGLDCSFGYHLDDNPRELLKVFVYLNDTYASNAAFRTFDYTVTKQLLRQGFISASPELRMASQRLVTSELIKEKLHVLEGKKGTVLVFDNNLVHRGTPPEQGYRDVLCIEVYPSDKPLDLEAVQKGLKAPIIRDYPLNPFYNDIRGRSRLPSSRLI